MLLCIPKAFGGSSMLQLIPKVITGVLSLHLILNVISGASMLLHFSYSASTVQYVQKMFKSVALMLQFI